MLAEIGFVAMILAFAASLYAVVASLYGARSRRTQFVLSGRNAAYLTAGMLTVACMSLLVALIIQDYSIAYVWSVSNPSMSLFFRTTALWGSQAGSLLFWSFLMSAFSAIAIALNWRSQRRLIPYVVAYSMAVLAFFLGLSLFIENPFERFWVLGGEVVEAALQPAGSFAPDYGRLADSAMG